MGEDPSMQPKEKATGRGCLLFGGEVPFLDRIVTGASKDGAASKTLCILLALIVLWVKTHQSRRKPEKRIVLNYSKYSFLAYPYDEAQPGAEGTLGFYCWL